MKPVDSVRLVAKAAVGCNKSWVDLVSVLYVVSGFSPFPLTSDVPDLVYEIFTRSTPFFVKVSFIRS